MQCDGFFIIIYLVLLLSALVGDGAIVRERDRDRKRHRYIENKYRHRSQRVTVQFCNSHGHKRQFCIRNGNL